MLLTDDHLSLVYLIFVAFPIVFDQTLSPGDSSLPFLSIIVGAIISVPISLSYQRKYMRDVKALGKSEPEMRLPMAELGMSSAKFSRMLLLSACKANNLVPAGGCLIVVAFLWLGWGGYKPSTPWIVPALSGIPLGIASVMIFVSQTDPVLLTLREVLIFYFVYSDPCKLTCLTLSKARQHLLWQHQSYPGVSSEVSQHRVFIRLSTNQLINRHPTNSCLPIIRHHFIYETGNKLGVYAPRWPDDVSGSGAVFVPEVCRFSCYSHQQRFIADVDVCRYGARIRKNSRFAQGRG